MPFEAIVLGLISAVRPTASAAIYALLTSDQPRRALLTYLVAGFVFSTSVGLLVVGVLHNVDGFRRDSVRGAVIDLMIGAAALGFAAGAGSGRLSWRPSEGRREPSPWVARLRDPSFGMLVGAGVATHLPGLFYLAALSVINAGDPGLIQGAVEVLIFNGLWYSTGVAALVAFILRPDATRRRVDAIRTWLTENERAVVIIVFAVTGAYFTFTGLHTLLT
ncbi:MAG: GAP family protein [Solirubrobacteraceae bacterium]|nr:GAP family protein [Solirubrobacteraceae bacterium]